MSLIGVLLVLLVACIVYWAATKLMAAFEIGDPIRTVVLVLLVLVLLIYLVGAFGVSIPGIRLHT